MSDSQLDHLEKVLGISHEHISYFAQTAILPFPTLSVRENADAEITADGGKNISVYEGIAEQNNLLVPIKQLLIQRGISFKEYSVTLGNPEELQALSKETRTLLLNSMSKDEFTNYINLILKQFRENPLRINTYEEALYHYALALETSNYFRGEGATNSGVVAFLEIRLLDMTGENAPLTSGDKHSFSINSLAKMRELLTIRNEVLKLN